MTTAPSYREKLAFLAKYPAGAGEGTRRRIDEGGDDRRNRVADKIERIAAGPTMATHTFFAVDPGATATMGGRFTAERAETLGIAPKTERIAAADLSQLVAQQRLLKTAQLADLVRRGGIVEHPDEAITIVRQGGKSYIDDGHHRLAAAKALKQPVEVVVYDVPDAVELTAKYPAGAGEGTRRRIDEGREGNEGKQLPVELAGSKGTPREAKSVWGQTHEKLAAAMAKDVTVLDGQPIQIKARSSYDLDEGGEGSVDVRVHAIDPETGDVVTAKLYAMVEKDVPFGEFGGKAMYINEVTVPPPMRNSKVALTLIRNAVQVAEHAGLDTLAFQANIDMGGFAWARIGGQARDPEQFVDDVKQRVALVKAGTLKTARPLKDPDGFVKLVTEHADHPDVAFIATQHPDGRQILRGMKWDAEMRLNDQTAMARFHKFLP